MSEQNCYKCVGSGVTEKVEYTVELDQKGNQVAARHSFISPCASCNGTGKVYT